MKTLSTSTPNSEIAKLTYNWKRIAQGTLGVLLVIIAAIGVFLPGIPTTGPLLLASYLLTKAHPGLEKLLIRNRFFKRYHDFLDGKVPFTTKQRILATMCMWTFIAISGWMLSDSPTTLAILILSGIAGTICIALFRRNTQPEVTRS